MVSHLKFMPELPTVQLVVIVFDRLLEPSLTGTIAACKGCGAMQASQQKFWPTYRHLTTTLKKGSIFTRTNVKLRAGSPGFRRGSHHSVVTLFNEWPGTG